ncbi:MAG: type IV pili methyl-accepting chemotaxis transducer N-terminal domain-containing protein, partial [Motiliproteus sp.]
MKIKKSSSILRNLTVRYLVALALIAILVTTSSLALEVLISEQDAASAVINISGRQRMLSQRIALYSFALISSPTSGEQQRMRSKLLAAVDLMEKSHQGLLRGDNELGVPGEVSPQVEALYYGDPVNLNSKLQSYLSSARALASLPASQLRSNKLGLDVYLERRSEDILSALDQVVKQYQHGAEQAVDRISRLELLVWVFTIFLLGVEALLIFRPMAQKVVRQ